MLDRVEMRIVHVNRKVAIVADRVLPVPPLPNAAFRDRAPRIERIDGADQIVVEADQILSGIGGLISNAGARFEAPRPSPPVGRFEDVHRGGYDPEQHLEDMEFDGVAGEVLYPSQGLFYFKVADPDSVRLDNAIEIDYPFMDNPRPCLKRQSLCGSTSSARTFHRGRALPALARSLTGAGQGLG
jgi:hypothetical protein